jgi:PmbA protein
MTDLTLLEADALKLVSEAKTAGADACDVVVASSKSHSVGIRDGEIENSKRSESDSLSLRVFVGDKVASVTGNSRTGLDRLAERAVAMAKVSPDDPYQGLADQNRLYDVENLAHDIKTLDLLDETDPSAAYLEALARKCEQAGLGVKGVSKSIGAGSGWSRSGFVLATSDGFSASYERSGASLSATMVAGEGTTMERDYDFSSAIHLEDLDAPEDVGRSAGERVVKRIGPKQVKSGSYPIVWDRRISAGLLGTLMGAINASSVVRKTSFLRDMMGKQVTAKGIHIIDDPLMIRRPGSKPFDGEGVATSKIDFIKDGELQEWVLDSASAKELGLTTNGRAGRGGTGTSPSSTNSFMQAGDVSFKDMISGISDGLYLTETIGHGINMVTGDYSKGAAGYWIKNGEITHPVAEITVAGNLKDMFMNMTPADDLEFRYGSDAPTLLIEGMTIGGN